MSSANICEGASSAALAAWMGAITRCDQLESERSQLVETCAALVIERDLAIVALRQQSADSDREMKRTAHMLHCLRFDADTSRLCAVHIGKVLRHTATVLAMVDLVNVPDRFHKEVIHAIQMCDDVDALIPSGAA